MKFTRRALFALVAGIVSGKAASTDRIASKLTSLMGDIKPFWEYRIKKPRTYTSDEPEYTYGFTGFKKIGS